VHAGPIRDALDEILYISSLKVNKYLPRPRGSTSASSSAFVAHVRQRLMLEGASSWSAWATDHMTHAAGWGGFPNLLTGCGLVHTPHFHDAPQCERNVPHRPPLLDGTAFSLHLGRGRPACFGQLPDALSPLWRIKFCRNFVP